MMIKDEYEDTDFCISHENFLWYLFRFLSEEIDVPDRIGQNVMRMIGGQL